MVVVLVGAADATIRREPECAPPKPLPMKRGSVCACVWEEGKGGEWRVDEL